MLKLNSVVAMDNHLDISSFIKFFINIYILDTGYTQRTDNAIDSMYKSPLAIVVIPWFCEESHLEFASPLPAALHPFGTSASELAVKFGVYAARGVTYSETLLDVRRHRS